jgi:hypothetical protein
MSTPIPQTVLEYELSVDHWVPAYLRAMDQSIEQRKDELASKWMRELGIPALFVAAAAIYVTVKWTTTSQVPWTAMGVLVVFFAVLLAGSQAKRSFRIVAQRGMEKSLREGKIRVPIAATRLWMDEHGIHLSNEWGSSLHLWRSVREAADLGDVLLVVFQFDIQTVIPKRAFADEASMIEFINAVRSRCCPPTNRAVRTPS